jgi:hypothetical protein
MASEKVNIVIKAVDKTKGTFRAVTAGLNAVKKAAFSLKSGLLALGGAAGLGYLIKRSMNTTDALGKVASKIGISTEALGGLRYAAEQTGVATDTLDMALQRMVRRISEASIGTGEAVKALKELNIDAKKLSKLSTDEQFNAIADAMAGVTNQSDKVRLAMRLFDSEGVALVNTLKGGSDVLNAYQKRAKELGMTLNGDLVKGVEQANDAISTFQGFLGGMFHRTVAELAPLIKGITQDMMAWVELKVQDGGGAGKVARGIAIAVVNSTKTIVESFGTVANSIIQLGNVASQVGNFLNEWFGEITTEKAQAQIADINHQLFVMNKALQDQPEIYSDHVIEGLNQEAVALKNKRAELQHMIDTATTWTQLKPMQPIDTGESIKWLDELLEKMKGTQIPVVDIGDNDIKGNNQALDVARDEYSSLLDLQDNYQSMYEGQQSDHYRKLIEQTSLWHRKNAAMQEIARSGNIQSLRDSGKEVVSTLSGTYKWAFDLHKGFAIKDALIDTYKAVSTALSSAPPPANYGLAAVALAKGIATVQSLRGTQYREKGGPVSKGKPYIVGERGPELIVPNQAATVIPNDQISGPVNVNFNITANDTRGFDQLLQQRRGQIVGIINQAMNDRGQRAIA